VRRSKRPTSLSPDGRWLLFDQYTSATKNDILALPLVDDGEPKLFLQTEFDEQRAVFSPNGQWVAYSARESGRHEVYVAPFPGPGRKWQISTEGGTYPHWRTDGQELIYSRSDGQLMAVEVRSDTDSFRVGEARPLFRIGPPQPFGPGFSISPDGQQLLVSQIFGRQAETVLYLIVNWPAELESP
jgi:Tol biopolymer transport system component